MQIRTIASKASRFTPKDGTYPVGFQVGGAHCGVKKNGDLDLALLVSDRPCSASAVFTTNVFKAAPVQVSQQVLKNTQGRGLRALVINSGNANAVTGETGMKDSNAMVDVTDKSIKSESDRESSLVMSTGVIGQTLPIEKILTGIPNLAKNLGSTHEKWVECCKAICTTDTFPKMLSREFQIGEDKYKIAGLAKGAGMIHPNMATLLGMFVTDAPVTPQALNQILKHAAERSFNSISVDGDMSTNDTVAALANGAAGGQEIDIDNKERFEKLQQEVTKFAQHLAQLVVRDGEGATKFVTINIEDAQSYSEAKKIAETIATSALVKTALYGKDANWGRILCATGYSGVHVDPSRTTVSFVPNDGSKEELKLLVNGEPQNVDEDRALEILNEEDVNIRVNVGTGGGQGSTYWTCDMSHEYVTINGEYRT